MHECRLRRLWSRCIVSCVAIRSDLLRDASVWRSTSGRDRSVVQKRDASIHANCALDKTETTGVFVAGDVRGGPAGSWMLFWRRSLAVGARQERHHFEHDAPTDLGCDSHPAAPSPGSTFQLPATLGSSTRPYWILEKFSVSPLLDAGLSESMLVAYFDNPQTFLIVKVADPARTHSCRTPLRDELCRLPANGGRDLFGVDTLLHQVVLYDDEKWPATPSRNSNNPSPTRRRPKPWRTNTAWDWSSRRR